MERISKRENYIRAARRHSPQWIPWDFSLTPEVEQDMVMNLGISTKGDISSYGRREDNIVEYALMKELIEHFDFDLRNAGTVQASPPWNLENVKTPIDVDHYDWDSLSTPEMSSLMPEIVQSIRKRGYVTQVGGPNFFEEFWGLMGFECFLLEMGKNSPLAQRIFDRLGEVEVRTAEYCARSGADVLGSSGDIASQLGPLISPSMWKRYIYPIMKEAYATARRIKPDILIFFHSCGNVMPFIESLIEVGVDILDPIQPEAMDIFELKRRYGDVLGFHGGIGVQSILPYGTPQEVRDTVRKTIEIMGDGGGYLCSTSHSILPGTPFENIMAFIETVMEYGVYL